MSYSEYLETDHWKGVSKKIRDLAEHRCQLCYGEGELHVHHRTYERLGEERLSDLICLCADCHAKHHSKTSCPLCDSKYKVISKHKYNDDYSIEVRVSENDAGGW